MHTTDVHSIGSTINDLEDSAIILVKHSGDIRLFTTGAQSAQDKRRGLALRMYEK